MYFFTLSILPVAAATHRGCRDCSRHPSSRSAAGLQQLAGVGGIGLGYGRRGRAVVDVHRPGLDLTGGGDVDEARAAIDRGALQRVERAAGVPASVRGGAWVDGDLAVGEGGGGV